MSYLFLCQVLKWNGQDPPEDQWRVSGGETITGLTFDVLDDQGNVMPFDPLWFRPKNAGVIMSWLAPPSGKAKAKKVTDNRLADITIPLGEER